MKKTHNAKLIGDVLWVNDDIYCEFRIPEDRRGFKLSDVVSWLVNIKEDPFRELKNRVITELNIINPNSVKTRTGIHSWREVGKDIRDKIIDAEFFYFSTEYERRGDIFFRRNQFDPITRDTVKVKVRFLVADSSYDDYNEFSLGVWIPTPPDAPELSDRIRDKVNEIISDLEENRKIKREHVSAYGTSTAEGRHYMSEYEERINPKSVSEAVEMVLSVIDNMGELLEEIKEHYSL